MRQDLLHLAESFLTSESVQSSDKESKIHFLRNKGLKDEEIEEAFKRVEGDTAIHQTVFPTSQIPTRPSSLTQIIYYSPAPIPRMTNIQIVSYAMLVAVGTFGFTVALTSIIKKIMSKILRTISNYQANRYKQTANLLNRINSCIQVQQTNTNLETEQIKLNDSLDRLVQLTQQIKNDREDQPYQDLKSDIGRFTDTILQSSLTPNHNTYNETSGFSNRYRDNNSAAVQNIKSEIRSFKGMLLSRRNFPVVTPVGALVIPTIRHSVIPAPVEQSPIYHPRRKRSFRSELSPLVKDSA